MNKEEFIEDQRKRYYDIYKVDRFANISFDSTNEEFTQVGLRVRLPHALIEDETPVFANFGGKVAGGEADFIIEKIKEQNYPVQDIERSEISAKIRQAITQVGVENAVVLTYFSPPYNIFHYPARGGVFFPPNIPVVQIKALKNMIMVLDKTALRVKYRKFLEAQSNRETNLHTVVRLRGVGLDPEFLIRVVLKVENIPRSKIKIFSVEY